MDSGDYSTDDSKKREVEENYETNIFKKKVFKTSSKTGTRTKLNTGEQSIKGKQHSIKRKSKKKRKTNICQKLSRKVRKRRKK